MDSAAELAVKNWYVQNLKMLCLQGLGLWGSPIKIECDLTEATTPNTCALWALHEQLVVGSNHAKDFTNGIQPVRKLTDDEFDGHFRMQSFERSLQLLPRQDRIGKKKEEHEIEIRKVRQDRCDWSCLPCCHRQCVLQQQLQVARPARREERAEALHDVLRQTIPAAQEPGRAPLNARIRHERCNTNARTSGHFEAVS